jgi:class 3 adenylate cyclase/tetratricopeptide (TPR) repeat protein
VTGDLSQWLEELGLGQYAQAFVDNDIEVDSLSRLTEDDLKELGLSIGHRRKLQAGIEALSADEPPASPKAPAPHVAPQPTEAERRQLTVLFCDLVGSTELSAKLDPEDMRDVLRAYQEACSKVIDCYEGYVAKFMGDGVYAYFGYPKAHEDDAERAITAGLGILEAVGGLQQDLAVRIGIATGNVAVGDLIGKGASEEANVVGEAPNLAGRLQGVAEPNTVVIGDMTHTLAGRLFETEDLGPHEFKGFAAPINVWSVKGQKRSESRFEAISAGRLTDLVGRDEELEILGRRWQRAKNGEGQVVLISGEAGIGKSRLVHAFRETLEEDHIAFRVLQCSPNQTNSALLPFYEPILAQMGIAPDDTDEAKLDKLEAWIRLMGQEPDEVAPLFGALVNFDTSSRYPPLNVSPQKQRAMLLEAFAQRFVRASEKHGLILVVEDAHWIDPTSLEHLNLHIAQAQDQPNAMVIVTYRPEFNAPWIGQPHATLIALNRLSRRQCKTIVANISRGASLSTQLIEQIAQRTDGVPLFLEELTRAVLETSQDGRVATGRDVPTTLQDSLEARLDRLGTAKEIAQIGAVIGRSFDYELLSHVAAQDDLALNQALDGLVDSGLLTVNGTVPNATYTFKHALVQDTAYRSLLRKPRMDIHARIGKSLEDHPPDMVVTEPEILAHHYTEADLTELAIPLWCRAGKRAIEQSADVEAVAHLNRALALVLTLPESRERDELELECQTELIGPLYAARGIATPEADTAQSRALELCDKLGERKKVFTVLLGRYTYHVVTSQSNDALRFAEEFLRRGEQKDDDGLRAVGHRIVGAASWCTGNYVAARDHLRQALELYDAEHHADLALTYVLDVPIPALAMLSGIEWYLGKPDQAAAYLNESLRTAQALDHVNSTVFALMQGGIVFRTLARDFVSACRHAEDLLRIAEEYGLPWWAQTARFHLGRVLLEDGHTDDGLEKMREALGDPDAANRTFYWSWHATVLSEALANSGYLDQASQLIDEAQSLIEKGGERWFESEIWRVRGDIVLASGLDTDAETHYRRGIEIARVQQAKSLELRAATSLARLWQSQSKTAEARDLLAPVYGWFTEGFDTADLKEAKTLLGELS